ncbi:MAG: dephospho-CoA kinase [Taibaiella sp.]|nr:dephospho-CoA kinase [Taibaiella sp.]
MLKVGVTGGIGAGKSVVCRVFHTLGIPVFNADDTAKQLMETNPALVTAIQSLFGSNIYMDGRLDRKKLASIVFEQPALLQQLNALVHPATIAFGNQWMATQTSPYVIKEAAIFFESGSYKEMDVMIGVSAPENIRINRAMQREGMTREKVMQRIASQMDDTEKMSRCDYVIINDGTTAIIPQVLQVHRALLGKSA